jgi:hypothetical protein
MPAATMSSGHIGQSALATSSEGRGPRRRSSRTSRTAWARSVRSPLGAGGAGTRSHPECVDSGASFGRLSRTPTERRTVATICRPQSKRARVLVVPPSRATVHIRAAIGLGRIFSLFPFLAFSLPWNPNQAILGAPDSIVRPRYLRIVFSLRAARVNRTSPGHLAPSRT